MRQPLQATSPAIVSLVSDTARPGGIFANFSLQFAPWTRLSPTWTWRSPRSLAPRRTITSSPAAVRCLSRAAKSRPTRAASSSGTPIPNRHGVRSARSAGGGGAQLVTIIAQARGSQIAVGGSTNSLLRNERGEWRRLLQADQILFLSPRDSRPDRPFRRGASEGVPGRGSGGGQHHGRSPRQSGLV